MIPITVRKTLARFSFYASKSQEGLEHKKILELMEFTEEQFQYMIDQSILVANSDDYDLDVVLADNIHKSPIGGCYIIKNGSTLAYL
jgi:hypothetical protein